MTPEQQAACQALLDDVMREFDVPGIVGKVREHVAWTSDEGEMFPAEWVAEVRFRPIEGQFGMRVVVLDPSGFDTSPEQWKDFARQMIGDMVGR